MNKLFVGVGTLHIVAGASVLGIAISDKRLRKPKAILGGLAGVVLGLAVLQRGLQGSNALQERLMQGQLTAADLQARMVELKNPPNFTDVHFQTIKKFSELRSLTLNDLPKLRDIGALKSCQHLIAIKIQGCPQISADAIRDLLRDCPNLKKIHIDKKLSWRERLHLWFPKYKWAATFTN